METTAMRDETRRPMVERVPPPETETRLGTVTKSVSVLQEFIRRVEILASRTDALGDTVEELADRAVGSMLKSPGPDESPGAPYGGLFSELFYATSALEARMDRLETEVGRLACIA
jgi:hypothetical protein